MRCRCPVAVHVFFLMDGQILMLRRTNTGFQDGRYSVVAGHVEEGESATRAALREITEEAGVTVAEDDLQPVSVMHRRSDEARIDYFFTVTRWQGDLRNAEPHKRDDLRFFPLSELPDNTVPYVRRALANLREGRTFAEFGW